MSKHIKEQGPKPCPAPNLPCGTLGPGVRTLQDYGQKTS